MGCWRDCHTEILGGVVGTQLSIGIIYLSILTLEGLEKGLGISAGILGQIIAVVLVFNGLNSIHQAGEANNNQSGAIPYQTLESSGPPAPFKSKKRGD